MEITIGVVALSALLMVVLQVIYKIAPAIPDRWKALIAMLAGIALGLVAMLYNEPAFTTKLVIDYILAGFMAGAAASGLYEGERSLLKPRE